MTRAEILFDPVAHRYTDTLGRVYTSVTTLLGWYSGKDFNTKYWGMFKALEVRPSVQKVKAHDDEKHYTVFYYSHTTGKVEELVLTLDELLCKPEFEQIRTVYYEILNTWKSKAKEATDAGHEEHNYLEDCIDDLYRGKDQLQIGDIAINRDFKYKVTTIQELDVSPFKSTHPSIYLMLADAIGAGYTLYAEKRLYSVDHLLCGTSDLVMERNGDCYIVDWKTNKDKLHFESGYYKKVWNTDKTKKIKGEWVKSYKPTYMQYPVSHIESSKGTGYQLQLSIYGRLCEYWGLNCLGLILVHIQRMVDENDEPILDERQKQKYHTPVFYQLPILRTEVDNILNHNFSLRVKQSK